MLRFSRNGVPTAEKKPRILDGAGAKAWLATMSQPASIENLEEISDVLHTLGVHGVQDASSALEPQRKFAVAERIRGALLQVLGERSTGDHAVLPLDDDFALHFWAAIDAAIALRDVYAWLVSQLADEPVLPETTLSGAPPTAANNGMLVSGVGALHRALDVNAQILLWVQRARWQVPENLWERHCVLGQLVRELDCQDVEVADALRSSITRTCRAAFAMPVLVALADPASRSAAEFEVVRMAAQRWAAKVGFRLERRPDGAMSSKPSSPTRPINPGPVVALGSFVVRLDTQSALTSIERRLEALGLGKTPREVGIGDSLRPQVARELLAALKLRWGTVAPGEIESPDRTWRPAALGIQVIAMIGMPGGEARRREGDGGGLGAVRSAPTTYAYHRRRTDGITKPRDMIENEKIERLLTHAELWTLAAESADAVRCIRKHARPRIGLHRLIGLRLGTEDRKAPFLVGWVEALQGGTVEHDEQKFRQSAAHFVRVRLAPGVPQVLLASIDDVELESAFLLVPSVVAGSSRGPRPAAGYLPMLSDVGVDAEVLAGLEGEDWQPVIAAPANYSLILPLASFRPHRLVKAVRGGAVAMLRLDELTMRGSDFDLVRFTPQ